MKTKRRSKFISLTVFVMVLTISGCTPIRTTHERLNGVLWAQTSVEHGLASIQSFAKARASVIQGLRDNTWTAALEQTGPVRDLQPAVIVDVDETVLNNTPFQARLLEAGVGYDPRVWKSWVNESKAEAMPGAKDFISFVKSKNVKVFYVTNREIEKPTVENIKNVLDPDVSSVNVLCKNERPGWDRRKTSRRQFIAQNYRIILLIGDDYNDFAYLGEVKPEERVQKAKLHLSYWQDKWVLISNPMYGNWEKALYGYDYKLSDSEKLKLKYKYLNSN